MIDALSSGWSYDLLQALLGGRRNRRWLQREFMQAKPGERVLDVGCGTADVLSVLPDVEYIGFDISDAYIARAKTRWGGRGRFYAQEPDPSTLKSLGTFDLILATGVLHHLDDRKVEGLLESLAAARGPRGRVVTLDGCYVDGQNPLARFLIGRDRGKNVRTPQAYLALARPSLPDVRGWLVHRAWFPYTYWIMRAGRNE